MLNFPISCYSDTIWASAKNCTLAFECCYDQMEPEATLQTRSPVSWQWLWSMATNRTDKIPQRLGEKAWGIATVSFIASTSSLR